MQTFLAGKPARYMLIAVCYVRLYYVQRRKIEALLRQGSAIEATVAFSLL